MDCFNNLKEMPFLDQLSTQERLMLAKKLRIQQVKQWQQREKDFLKKSSKSSNIFRANCIPKNKNVSFDDSVVLLEAAARNDISEVKQLLQKNVNPNSTNEDGLTALHQCCIDNNEAMLQLLIDFGANVNAIDCEKWTPLHAAATCGHLKVIKRLIANGAHLLAVNADGNMPYDICEDENALDFIESEMAKRGVTQEMIDETRSVTEMRMLNDLKALIKNGTDLNGLCFNGCSALHIAAANGYASVVELLLDNNVQIDVVDEDLWQPVHAAACWGHMEILEILVQHGANLSSRNKYDETPADICEDPEMHQKIVQLQNEQEQKKQTEKRRSAGLIRRSYSNSRSQSVRRISIRDKLLVTKKDAAEEARLLLEAEELHEANDRSDPDGQSSARDNETDSVMDKKTVPSEIKSIIKPQTVLDENFELENQDSINVRVFVSINNGSLSELKKQRSKVRKNTVINNESIDKTSLSNSSSLSYANNNDDINRFSGPIAPEASDAIGEYSSFRCCTIS